MIRRASTRSSARVVRVVSQRTRDRWTTTVLVTLLFTAVTVVLAYPLSIHPASLSFGSDPDVHLFTWVLAWDVHALTSDPLHIFDANILYPYPRTLAFSENLIGDVLFAAPAIWLTGSPVFAMNVVSLASCVLCGLGAFVLARRLGLSIGAAVICGLIFGFSPARFFRFGQIHLATIQWIPFALASLAAYFDDGHRRDLWLATGFFSLQALSSGHGAVYLAVAGTGYVVFRFATGGPIALTRRARDVGVVGALLLVPAVLIVPPYLQVQREMGLKRTLENWETAPESFLASPTLVHSRLLSAFSARRVNERASAFLFPGYLPLFLASAALVLATSGAQYRWHTWFFLILTMLSALLSAGPPVSLWPYVYWLPGLNFIRIPSRFMLLGILGVAALAAIGFERIASRLRGDTRLAVEIVTAMLLVAEFWTPLSPQAYHVEIPAVDRWLDSRPKPFAIAEVPVRPLVRYHSTYMLHSMAHWQRTVHGHSGLETPLHLELYEQLRTFPDDASVENLRSLGVAYVVVHIDWYRPGEWDRVRPQFDRYASVLTLVHEDESGRVYAFEAGGQVGQVGQVRQVRTRGREVASVE